MSTRLQQLIESGTEAKLVCGCEVPMFPHEVKQVRWCPRRDCPCTDQQEPTERQIGMLNLEQYK